MTKAFVYLLACSDGTLYAGYTTDLARRLRVHNSGRGARYTRGRLPVVLAYHEELADESKAKRREIQIKRMSRSAKLLLCRRFPTT